MTVVQAFLLWVVQGLTEFLPVSSDGHLVISQRLLGLTQPLVAFDVILHSATLVAILIYFFKDFFRLTPRLWWYLVMASIPTAIVGLLVEPVIDTLFGSLAVVTVSLFVNGLFLISTTRLLQRRSVNELKQLKFSQALAVGLIQPVALLPGFSRSGSTVTIGLWAGMSKEAAFRFSFLLAVPALIGAQIVQFNNGNILRELPLFSVGVGFIAALVTGIIAIKVLDVVIRAAKLHYFGFYCVGLSFLVALWAIVG